VWVCGVGVCGVGVWCGFVWVCGWVCVWVCVCCVCGCVCGFCNVWILLVICTYCTVTEVSLNLTEVFLTLTEVFPCFSLSCKANTRIKLAKMGHGPHSFTLVCICVVRLLFVLFGYYLCCSMCCLCVNVYCHRVTFI
jgi:hypothetical protein